MDPVVLVLPFRAISLKNHQQIKTRYIRGRQTRMICKSDAAEQALQLAQGFLRSQYKGKPISQQVHLDITFEYKNAQNVPDIDNAENFVMDALKGIVLHDDGWRFVGQLGVSKRHIIKAPADRISIRITGGEGL